MLKNPKAMVPWLNDSNASGILTLLLRTEAAGQRTENRCQITDNRIISNSE
jgi:hypothetical protein